VALLSGHFDLRALEASIDKTNYTTALTFEKDPRQYKVDVAFTDD